MGQVYGNKPSKYKSGLTAWDKSVDAPTDDEARLTGTKDCYDWAKKAEVVSRLRQRLRLCSGEGIFVDDDIKQIETVCGKCYGLGEGASGPSQEHLEEIEESTRPSRLPWPLLSCLEPLLMLQLNWHAQLQIEAGTKSRLLAIGSVHDTKGKTRSL